MKHSQLLAALALIFTAQAGNAAAATVPFDADWRFFRADDSRASSREFNDRAWESVILPHTARIEPLVTGKSGPQWQGICWYRKTFELPAEARGKSIWLRFEGAMNVAEFWLNGQPAGRFMGGYLPYVMDVSTLARPGEKNVIAVRLDNRDNPITGPKPLKILDFNLYGGLYRGATLIIKDRLHITDPILAGKVASGGVFVDFSAVSAEAATVRVRTHVQNTDTAARAATLRTTLLDDAGKVVVSAESACGPVTPGSDAGLVQELTVAHPKLWSPDSPNLYHVRSELLDSGRTIDAEQTRVGIRRIQIDQDGFRINGRRMFLRGTNRHQEYPYIGNALSDAAQYRDARKIKEAGFDYIRLSHYPQSPAFMDACDELGLVVMNCIMGWQYFGEDPAFTALKLQECRQLVRRDRNHPCVILWEVSLNETKMPDSFITQTHAIAHEEYPGDQCFTCGWQTGYDVFIDARQHTGCREVKDLPCVVSEYGDWEYFAQNAGLEQDKWKDLQPADRSSRQLRGAGEVRLLQQATNFQEAHNDNLKTIAFADGIWVMYDYNRGYHDEIESSGVMDIFRLPKFGTWFFRSQREPGEIVAGQPAGPMVFIASYWTPASPPDVRVFSNCEEVALYLDDRRIEQRRPDTGRTTTHVKHAPFTFKLDRFQAGTLRAVGLIGGREVARLECRTPGGAAKLALRFDLGGKPFAAAGKDTIFCHAELLDAAGTPVPTESMPVFFGTTGRARLVGSNPIAIEAGTASILLESDVAEPRSAVYAVSLVREGGLTRVLAASASPDGGKVGDFEVRCTTDGSEPTATSPRYAQPLSAPQLRGVILVGGVIVARFDSRDRAASTHDLAGSAILSLVPAGEG